MRNPIFRDTEDLNPAMKDDNYFDSIRRGERRFAHTILSGELPFAPTGAKILKIRRNNI
jgi:hypothetical protein